MTFLRMLMGKGLGVWKTIPAARRSRETEGAFGPAVGLRIPPSKTRTSPELSQPSKHSFSRFKALRNVVFPDPERPSRTVILRAVKSVSMP